MTSTLAVFIVAAIVLSTINYGGMMWLYALEQRRIDPPRHPSTVPFPASPDPRVHDHERAAA
ncbi:hypothetical protein [Nocardioides astragali]|uniref:Uncharacterized protein n=1 Tax=Nocardioides astragali TaxID=1776736 RepID=A0ABW2N169_9ACTN|nr:hypothetical protein [Nocardioides astragali]